MRPRRSPSPTAYGQSVNRKLGLAVDAPATTTTTPPPAKLAKLTPPQITGNLSPHHALTCTPGTWSNPASTFTYAWFAVEPKPPAAQVKIETKAKVFGLKSSKKLINEAVQQVAAEVSVLVG